MKSIIIVLVGLSIGMVVAIATVQLLKVFLQEMTDFVNEAWHSPENH